MDLSEQRKREKEFNELKRRNQEWLDGALDEMAEFLLDLWLWKKEQEEKDKPDEDGSIPANH
jgi:hypothetical protein